MDLGNTMNKKITATVITACFMFSVTACDGHTRATILQTPETFATASQSSDPAESRNSLLEDDMTESITLYGSADDTYAFTYDSDVITYSGQGGRFFLVGSSPTECYLHIMVQSGNETYEEALETEAGRIVKQFTLDSGRRAFCYKTNDASADHVIIESDGIGLSGTGLIKITIGSADSWLYSYTDIANMVDRGFTQ